MSDNDNEGHEGATIDQIAAFASASLSERPNVVLIHAGTSDMSLPLNPAGAPTRLGSLIDKVLATCPDALVLVSQIIPSGNSATRDNIVAYNAAIPGIVAARTATGSKVMVVDMFSRLLTPDHYADDLHPNNSGYTIMGDAWSYAMAYANYALGWISPPGAGSTESTMQIAIASYTNPSGDAAAWSRLISYDTDKLSVLVANVLNGPDYVVDSSWNSVIERAAGSGKKIIGYVRTGYLGVSEQAFKTRLGSRDLADWASQIEQDIDKWFELYPAIGGIFFDEGWPECGPSNIYSNLYAYINDYTKRKHPGAYTVLNPGSPIAQCYEETMDTLLTFEQDYEAYISKFVPNNWTPKDTRKIWHIVYRVPQDKIAEALKLALSRNIGYFELTNDDKPNPYDVVPPEDYMQAIMKAVSGGKVHVDPASTLKGSYTIGQPSDSSVVASDYTSVTIEWSPVARALGYAIYQGGNLVLEMPSSLTRATVGMLKPGTSDLLFDVRTVLASGGQGTSRWLTATTKKLPSAGSISSVSQRREGNTAIYTAEVLVPYAFVRLFIGGPHKPIGASGGWPIDAGLSTENGGGDAIGTYKLVNYLVEGNDFYSELYHYVGAYIEGGGNADWSWSTLVETKITNSGYTYTWNIPLGSADAELSEYVVQGQGYAPLQNVFGGSLRSYKCAGEPCDDNADYDCKGSSLCSTPGLLAWCDHAVNALTRTDALTYGTS